MCPEGGEAGKPPEDARLSGLRWAGGSCSGPVPPPQERSQADSPRALEPPSCRRRGSTSCSLSGPWGSTASTCGRDVRPAPESRRPLPAPSWASGKHPLCEGTVRCTRGPARGEASFPSSRDSCRLPVPAPLGHGVGPPGRPAASRCHPPLPRGQLTGAFDSPACGTQRPQPFLAEARPAPVPAHGGASRRRRLWPNGSVPEASKGGTLGRPRGRTSPQPFPPFLCGLEQSHTLWALVSPSANQRAAADGFKRRRRSSGGLGGSQPCLSPTYPLSGRYARASSPCDNGARKYSNAEFLMFAVGIH